MNKILATKHKYNARNKTPGEIDPRTSPNELQVSFLRCAPGIVYLSIYQKLWQELNTK